NPGDARLLHEFLKEVRTFPFELEHVTRLADAREHMMDAGAAVVLLDLSLPDAHGMETVTGMLEAAPDAAIIVLTGLDDEGTALEAVKAGAQDYLVKGQVEPGELARAIRYAQERKRLERERAHLLEREREARSVAEAAVRGRDEVLRVVSHDLGNSLGAVQLTTKVLLRTLADAPEDETRQRIQNIRVLAEQMQRLRQDLLDVAMLDAGRLSIEPCPLAPEALIESTADRYAPVAAERSIELQSRTPNGLPRVSGDEARLLQVFANLLTNAIKFSPVGAEIVMGAEPAGEEVCFYVLDNGPGIAEEHLPRLFDRFWTTRAGNPHGAGLGLAIAKGIVETHGGRIGVESGGGGTRFWFTVPAES
ncbi:MAG: ATP-binding protein, partial [Gemmatimonadota bacterium]